MKEKQTVTVVAECLVTTPDGSVKVRSFDKAWSLMRSSEKFPASIKFLGFVRKD
jgi:hypothetical protein